ncbi:unnamed protein product [Urochloa humidicola]
MNVRRPNSRYWTEHDEAPRIKAYDCIWSRTPTSSVGNQSAAVMASAGTAASAFGHIPAACRRSVGDTLAAS